MRELIFHIILIVFLIFLSTLMLVQGLRILMLIYEIGIIKVIVIFTVGIGFRLFGLLVRELLRIW